MKAHKISTHSELWKEIVLSLIASLIGRLPKSVRGITLNFDGKRIEVSYFFDSPPSEIDIENLQDAEAELISSHEYQSDISFMVVPTSESLADKAGNWGWVFLRHEEKESA